MPQAIHISPIDNVVVALHPIAKGTLVEVDGLSVTALEDIPQGHKMAVKPIKNGENVIKYGFPIGHATADAAPGSWMHTHNVHTNLSGEVEYSYNPAPDLAPLPKVEPETFMGFRRKDGRAAIRNEIWIIPTVGCVNDIAKKIVADNQDLVTGSIEGLYTFTHPFGCSQTGHDHAQTRKLLAALVRHPNAAAVLVLHLGCENLQHDQFVEELGEYDHDRVKFLTCQEVDDEFTAARDILKELAAYAGQFKREPIPVSDLVVGMKCGGSDGLSGITANPTIGRFSDMMGQRGGSTVLTEVPEMFGAEGFLMDRCINHDVFVKAEKISDSRLVQMDTSISLGDSENTQDGSARLLAMVSAGQINMIVTDADTFAEVNNRGDITKPAEIMGEAQLERIRDSLVDAKGNPVTDVKKAVGFDLSKSKVWKSVKGLPQQQMILGFSNVTKSKEMPVRFVEYLRFE